MTTNLSAKTPETHKHATLGDYSVLSLRGDDTVSFLQGQICGDIADLSPGQSQMTAATDPRGRVIAVLRVLRRDNGCDLVLPLELAATLAQRLRMYVMRAKVEIGLPANRHTIVAIWGPDLSPPPRIKTGSGDEQPGLLQLPGGVALLVSRASQDEIENQLVGYSVATSAADWVVAETAAGLPEISAATSESFIPQMLNLDLLGGVSFTKGCYVGQEVIARAHHLGKVKRRSRLFHVGGATTPIEGQSVMQGDRAVGKVVRVAEAENGYFLLAATPSSEGLTLDDKDATGLKAKTLPYSLPG